MYSIKLNVKFLILLIYAPLQICCGSDPATNLSCAADKDLDRKCQSYCYSVVKPLLQHASDVYQKEQEHSNLLAKIQQQEINIKSFQADQAILQAKIDAQNHLLTICKYQLAEKDALIENKNAVIKELQNEQEVITKTMPVDQDNLQAKVDAQNHSFTVSKDALIEHERNTCSKLCDSMLARLDWTVVQRRKDGRVNFNQTWSEYRQGFGNPQGEFFLGLEKLHLLTRSQPHELFIYLQNFENQTSFARYDHFLIGDESESFNIKSLGKYTGTAGDALIYHKGMKFSTIDRKNDLSEFHCAAEWSSGWWFNKCYHCNLNGVYRDESSSLHHGINWYTWNAEGRLSFVQIMIKPKRS